MCRVNSDDWIVHVFHFGKFPSSDPEETVAISFHIKKDAWREISPQT